MNFGAVGVDARRRVSKAGRLGKKRVALSGKKTKVRRFLPRGARGTRLAGGTGAAGLAVLAGSAGSTRRAGRAWAWVSGGIVRGEAFEVGFQKSARVSKRVNRTTAQGATNKANNESRNTPCK
jgi:hypothetical protein